MKDKGFDYLDPRELFNDLSFAVALMGGKCGHGGSNGAIGDGNISLPPGGSGIVDIGALG